MNGNNENVLRLVYPQWQGGIIERWLPELPPNDASQGYYLGSYLLNFLSPPTGQKTVEVPVSLDINDRAVEKGIHSRGAILRQTKAALEIIKAHEPEKIVTLGGDCAVSIVPFSWLAAKYPDDLAIIWIDAHPDVTLPYDDYQGYHAMALTACLGLGDEEIMDLLPGKVKASRALLVGLRSWDKGMRERQDELGIRGLSPEETAQDSSTVMQWLKGTGVTRIAVHFDMDVLDPGELIAAVGVEPYGMKIREVVRLINDIANEYNLVGLTIAEPMPRAAIMIRNMLQQLPLMKD